MSEPREGGSSVPVGITAVRTRRDWRTFFDIAEWIHRRDLAWIPPLRFERRRQWSGRNPFFDHARARAWLAWQQGRPVGCISAQLDELHEQTWGERVGYFGQLEGIDDPAVFRALLDAAADWLAGEGVTRMRGPYDLSVNQTCGLLVDGFEFPPVVMMGHAQPYYGPHVEAAGLQPVMDLLAYRVPGDFSTPDVMARAVRRFSRRLRVRPLDKRRFDEEMTLLKDIYNDAWSKNWGFVPLTRDEIVHLGHDLRPLIPPEYIQIAEVDGVPAAFIVLLPDVNEWVRDLGGRLLPFGWARLAWRIWRRRVQGSRVPLMGVRKSYQGTALGSALALAVIDAVRWPGRADGIQWVELSWVLETNQGLRGILESALGSELYKRYRIYERTLSAEGRAADDTGAGS